MYLTVAVMDSMAFELVIAAAVVVVVVAVLHVLDELPFHSELAVVCGYMWAVDHRVALSRMAWAGG